MLKVGNPTLARVIGSIVLVIVAFVVVKCYGNRRYDTGIAAARVAHSDSVRKEVKAALDSAERVMRPVLDQLMSQNDSLRNVARTTRVVAANALMRAARADSALQQIDPDKLEVTPPEVRLLIDRLTVSHDSLRVNLERVLGQNMQLDAQNTKLAASAKEWEEQYEKARSQIAEDEHEIATLKKQKTPSKVGFKTGFFVGALAVVGTLVAAAAVAH